MSRRALCALVLAAVAASGGCGGGDDPAPSPPAPASGPERPAEERSSEGRSAPPAPLRRAQCPPELSNCRTASGRIVYVERVDPDGDGDAHFVLASRQAITLPGFSVIDVKKSLRPHPLPGIGDRISAAGPVYHGSYGQRQIEAIELHVAR